jgi:hypothetical protein
MGQVEPAFMSILPYVRGIAVIVQVATLVLCAQSVLRYFTLRQINKEGYHDPQLQRLHLEHVAREKGKFITQPRLALVYGIVWGALAVANAVYLLSMWSDF